ncbi:MAG: class I SAM-dependent methyltransferase [Chthoniobacter sp.]
MLISYKDEPARDALHAGLRTWCTENGYAPRRVFVKFLPRQNAERIAPVLIEGRRRAAADHGRRGERHALRPGFRRGLFGGAFHRPARQSHLRALRLAAPAAEYLRLHVLLLRGGSPGRRGETVSIDLSKKSLDRGRENFALNHLDAAAQRFYADDVLDVLPRLARKNETFDTIILDPPTFSRGNKGRRFQVEEDIEALLLAALELAAPARAGARFHELHPAPAPCHRECRALRPQGHASRRGVSHGTAAAGYSARRRGADAMAGFEELRVCNG